MRKKKIQTSGRFFQLLRFDRKCEEKLQFLMKFWLNNKHNICLKNKNVCLSIILI